VCGIFGVINQNTSLKIVEQDLRDAVDVIRHRGPDDAGSYCYHNVGLAHRRLSIIDTSPAGHQPIFSEEGDIVIVFNGEIYNFQELKKDLIKKGHIFSSDTDTEVVVHLYQEYSCNLLDMLDGMFAFALYDTIKKRLFLAKDPFGKKPLFYAWQNQQLIFSSEIKAIVKYPNFRAEIQQLSLQKYLAFDYIPTPHSIYKSVLKLTAGSYIFIDINKPITQNSITPVKYFNIIFTPKLSISEPEAQEQLKILLVRAIRKRLISDVPLGIFLSGGLDSGGMLALLAQCGVSQLKTFCIGFNEPDYDESQYARQLAVLYGTDHHEEILGIDSLVQFLPTIIENLDEPFADASIIPTYLLSKFARRTITVALGGDGNDELFAGYDPFMAIPFSLLIERSQCLQKLAYMIASSPLLINSNLNMSIGFKLKHFLKGFSPETYGNCGLRNQLWMNTFSVTEIKSIFPWAYDLTFQQLLEDVLKQKCSQQELHHIDSVILNFLTFYMHDSILTKVDRASMMNSLEVRSPFLDKNYANFVNRLPVSFKMKHLTRKYLYKKVLKEILPLNIVKRKKKGFGIPTGKWLKGTLKTMMYDILYDGKLGKTGLFDMKFLRQLYDLHLQNKVDLRKEMWNILILGLWWEKHVRT